MKFFEFFYKSHNTVTQYLHNNRPEIVRGDRDKVKAHGLEGECRPRITETRKRLGYSRERLAEMSEISVQFLADIEKGRKSMTVATLRRLAAALNVTTDYIVNSTEDSSESPRLGAMLAALTPYQREQAEKLLAVFIETINRGD